MGSKMKGAVADKGAGSADGSGGAALRTEGWRSNATPPGQRAGGRAPARAAAEVEYERAGRARFEVEDERAGLLAEGDARSDGSFVGKGGKLSGMLSSSRRSRSSRAVSDVPGMPGVPPQAVQQFPQSSVAGLQQVGIGAELDALPPEVAQEAANDSALVAKVEEREEREERLRNRSAEVDTVTRLLSPKSSPGREVSGRISPTMTDESTDPAWARREASVVLEQVVPALPGGIDQVLESRQHMMTESQRRPKPSASPTSPALQGQASQELPPRPAASQGPRSAATLGRSGGSSAAAGSNGKAAGGRAGAPTVARSGSTDSLAADEGRAAGAHAHAVLDASDQAMKHAASGSKRNMTPRLAGRVGEKHAEAVLAGAIDPFVLPVEEATKVNQTKKWRVASRTVTMFSRRAAAGLGATDEPLNEEEEAAIAELTSGADDGDDLMY